MEHDMLWKNHCKWVMCSSRERNCFIQLSACRREDEDSKWARWMWNICVLTHPSIKFLQPILSWEWASCIILGDIGPRSQNFTVPLHRMYLGQGIWVHGMYCRTKPYISRVHPCCRAKEVFVPRWDICKGGTPFQSRFRSLDSYHLHGHTTVSFRLWWCRSQNAVLIAIRKPTDSPFRNMCRCVQSTESNLMQVQPRFVTRKDRARERPVLYHTSVLVSNDNEFHIYLPPKDRPKRILAVSEGYVIEVWGRLVLSDVGMTA